MTNSSPQSLAFYPDEKVSHGFVRVLGAIAIHVNQVGHAAPGTLTESIHEVRVSIKSLRALLWFAESAFSRTEVERTKSRLRKASQLLAADRDAVVMRSTLEQLSQKASNSRYRKALARFLQDQPNEKKTVKNSSHSLREAVGIILSAIECLRQKATSKSKWPSSSKRLKKAITGAEKAGRKAFHRGTQAQFHEWRKRTKRLLYQLQLTQADCGKRMRRNTKGVDHLQESSPERATEQAVAKDRKAQRQTPAKEKARPTAKASKRLRAPQAVLMRLVASLILPTAFP